jgi:hypothetical protein
MGTKDYQYALFTGLIASLVTTLISWLTRITGIGIGPEATWAIILGFGTSQPAWWLGFAVHIVTGSVIALGYCWLFNILDRSLNHWGTGLAVGLVHANFIGFLLIMSPKAGPVLFNGPSGVNLPKVMMWVFLHMIYGLTIWTLWEEVGEERQIYHYFPRRFGQRILGQRIHRKRVG